jgi:hypothetical protein
MAFDKELLFKPTLPEADVVVPGKGTVRVRALTRLEAMSCKESEGTAAIERKMLAMAMLDPPMTEGEVKRWQEASAAGEMDVVSNKVSELSGMLPGTDKATYKEFEADPATEFRLPPG